jgi:hypothetical protein
MPAYSDDAAGVASVRERPADACGSEKLWGWLWVPPLVLGGYLLFTHGCHRGDHDDELIVLTIGFPSARKLISRA